MSVEVMQELKVEAQTTFKKRDRDQSLRIVSKFVSLRQALEVHGTCSQAAWRDSGWLQ